MKDLIAKLHLDANCALGAIWMHIDAQAARIAELEEQLEDAEALIAQTNHCAAERISDFPSICATLQCHIAAVQSKFSTP